jgi:hypothetical protein
MMISFLAFFAGLIIGLGIGYAVGYNEVKHPGKLQDQTSSWWAKIKEKIHR